MESENMGGVVKDIKFDENLGRAIVTIASDTAPITTDDYKEETITVNTKKKKRAVDESPIEYNTDNLATKYIIVINGKGASGKDSLIKFLTTSLENYKIQVGNISSITPIRKLAKKAGCDPNDKSPKNRKFLSDLKKLLTEYNDCSMNYLLEETKLFIERGWQGILFVHIREPEEIQRYIDTIDKLYAESNYNNITNVVVRTMLIRRDGIEDYGNDSDDNVENYDYDIYFENNDSLIVSGHKFVLKLVSKLDLLDWS